MKYLTRKLELALSTICQKNLRELRKRLGAAIDTDALPEVVLSAARARRWDVSEIEAARNELVEACRDWAANLVFRIIPPGCLTHDDLKQAGICGLMKGALRYRGDRGKWSTYATWWIRQGIMRCIRSESRIIRIPEYALMNADRPEAKRVPMPFDIGAPTKDPGTPFDLVDKELRRLLTDRERLVIMSRFGLNGDLPLSLKRIGDTLHLSRERIRQIQNIALEKLQHSLILKDEHA